MYSEWTEISAETGWEEIGEVTDNWCNQHGGDTCTGGVKKPAEGQPLGTRGLKALKSAGFSKTPEGEHYWGKTKIPQSSVGAFVKAVTSTAGNSRLRTWEKVISQAKSNHALEMKKAKSVGEKQRINQVYGNFLAKAKKAYAGEREKADYWD